MHHLLHTLTFLSAALAFAQEGNSSTNDKPLSQDVGEAAKSAAGKLTFCTVFSLDWFSSLGC